jgi:hypothetical protein
LTVVVLVFSVFVLDLNWIIVNLRSTVVVDVVVVLKLR